MLLSRLPWPAAQALWKLLNLSFLVGCVLLTLRLFVGQSSHFVLCAALGGIVLSEQRRPGAAGICLALSLIKPHLVLPLLGYLLVRHRYRALLVAGGATAGLTLAGLHLGHDSLEGFLRALRPYAAWNSPTNPRIVGLANLAITVFGLPGSVSTLLSLSAGLAALAWLLVKARAGSRHESDEHTLPAVLVVSVLSFGAHSYDLVFLLPVCIWAIGKVQADRRLLPIVVLGAMLVLPLGAVTRAYDLLLSHALDDSILRVAVEPFRSWILLTLCVLVMYRWRAHGRGRAKGRAAQHERRHDCRRW